MLFLLSLETGMHEDHRGLGVRPSSSLFRGRGQGAPERSYRSPPFLCCQSEPHLSAAPSELRLFAVAYPRSLPSSAQEPRQVSSRRPLESVIRRAREAGLQKVRHEVPPPLKNVHRTSFECWAWRVSARGSSQSG